MLVLLSEALLLGRQEKIRISEVRGRLCVEGSELLSELGVSEMDDAKQSAEEAERCHVEVGPLSPPLGDDLVDVIRSPLPHDARVVLK